MSNYSDKHKSRPVCVTPDCENDATVLRLLKPIGVVWICDECREEMDRGN